VFLGRVIGAMEATFVYEGLEGVKLLWVQPELSDGTAAGDAIVACDATPQAGPGDRVYLVDGREAGLPLPVDFVPVDATIVGIVDAIDLPRSDRPGAGR
jgi:ethanolamine utilization protein EutN